MSSSRLSRAALSKWLDLLFLAVVAQGASASVVTHNFGDPTADLVLQWYGMAAAYVALSAVRSDGDQALRLVVCAGLGIGAALSFFHLVVISSSPDATSPIRWGHWLVLAFCFLGRAGSCGRIAK